MFQSLEQIDRDLFLSLNHTHTSWLDVLMYYATLPYTWIPLYLFLAYLIYKQVGKKVVTVVLFSIVLILISDQSSNLLKKSVKRYRPCYNLEIEKQVNVVGEYPGGKYGFVSSHAANVFALATFMFFILKNRKLKLALFLWAAIVSYSRVYVGVHYPSDIFVGGLLGVLSALLVHAVLRKVDSEVYTQ